MHVAARVGIAAVGAGAAGFGMYRLNEHVSNRTERQHAQLDRDVAEQSQAWESWKGKFDAEFPGGRLDTPADHARLDAFLRDNPAPSWISVEHEDYTRARIRISGDIVDPDLKPMAEREKAIGYGGIGVLGSVGMGAAMLASGMKMPPSSSLRMTGMLLGGAASVALGVGLAAGLVNDVRQGTNMDGYHALYGRVLADTQ